MIFSLEEKNRDSVALISDKGYTYSYGQLIDGIQMIGHALDKRCLIFVLCKNAPESVLGYLAAIEAGCVPLLLSASMDTASLRALADVYKPSYYWMPAKNNVENASAFETVLTIRDYSLIATGNEACEINEKLALLLATSGSTGNPKLVRLSRTNLESNAASIAEYLNIDETERPLTTLPMYYTYGLSVINSHLLKGAAILMTERTLFEQELWTFAEANAYTSMAGVPYTYAMLKRLKLFNKPAPAHLKTLTQAGGHLPESLQREVAEWAKENGVSFYVMYGQTEATARMSYIPPQMCEKKIGSIGIAIPGGSLMLADDDGNEISTPGEIGELIYKGENVSLGYAICQEDLAKGDERNGVLQTGDLASRYEDGYFFIQGRKSRFVKLFGIRIGLDACEDLLTEHYGEAVFACVGNDECLTIVTDNEACGDADEWLADRLAISGNVFRTVVLDAIPVKDNGKIDYKKIEMLTT